MTSDADLDRYGEYLDHNELELALDALAEVGVARQAASEFWLALVEAAREMGLHERADQLNRRSS